MELEELEQMIGTTLLCLKRIETDEEAIPGRQYLAHLQSKDSKIKTWAMGSYINGTLILPPEHNFGYKRLAFYEVPQN